MPFRVRWIERGEARLVYAGRRAIAEQIAGLLLREGLEGVTVEEMPGG